MPFETSDAFIAQWTDHYFNRTRDILATREPVTVTYAVFLRRSSISAPKFALSWLEDTVAARGGNLKIDLVYPEGKWVGAGEPIFYYTGLFHQLVDLETLLLQKLGAACIAAQNACLMASALPHVPFIAMDARHCAGADMAALMAYAASVGSARAVKKVNARGFIGNATAATCTNFSAQKPLGTVPHNLIGYAESTLGAATLVDAHFPDEPLTMLVDYFGQEISDAIALCRAFPARVANHSLQIRLDTPGSRYVEGLDRNRSYDVLERHVPQATKGYLTDFELNHLTGSGVSAAAVWWLREQLDDAGFPEVPIICSSGFTPQKCALFALAKAPVAMIGSGSFLPENWFETFATADVVAYAGVERVKVGREFLYPSRRTCVANAPVKPAL